MASKLVRPLTSLLLFAATAGVMAAPPQSPPRVAWVGAVVHDGAVRPGRPDRVVVTRGERIEALLPADGFHATSDMTVVDLHGQVLIPGLINTHVHLATSAQPDAARAYLRRELYSGVTAVRDMAGDARLLGELKREAEFNEIPSPDIEYVALMAGPAFFTNPKTQQAARGRVAGDAPWMQAIDEHTDLRLAVARAKGSGAAAIKVYADVSGPLLASVAREAHAQGLHVWSHAAVFPAKPSDAVQAGVDVVSHACMLGYEVTDPLPAVVPHPMMAVDVARLADQGARIDTLLAEMKARGTLLDATLFVYFSDDSGIDCSYATAAKLTARAWRAGVTLTAGTDDEPGDHAGAWSALIQETRLLHDDAGMPPSDVLRAATINGAQALGRDKDMGTIEVGKRANFVILAKDPMIDIRFLDTAVVTVKNGVAYERRAFEAGAAPSAHSP
jgi:imidazolonepropionase-like amidohydrolase